MTTKDFIRQFPELAQQIGIGSYSVPPNQRRGAQVNGVAGGSPDRPNNQADQVQHDLVAEQTGNPEWDQMSLDQRIDSINNRLMGCIELLAQLVSTRTDSDGEQHITINNNYGANASAGAGANSKGSRVNTLRQAMERSRTNGNRS